MCIANYVSFLTCTLHMIQLQIFNIFLTTTNIIVVKNVCFATEFLSSLYLKKI